jgi:8-oxo-dGTP pyrophosphatase MutT (NUDIX family)
MAERTARYQGAIVRDRCLLLIKHCHYADGHNYWLLPGGGREDGESEEQAVRREMREETNLDVRVERLLIDPPVPGMDDKYRVKTYLCTPVGGEASPGYEPEPDAAEAYAIAEVRWFDLSDPSSWDPQMVSDSITFPQVQRVRSLLGYTDS